MIKTPDSFILVFIRLYDFHNSPHKSRFTVFIEVNLVNFHPKCKILGGVAKFFSKAFLRRLPPKITPSRLVYPILLQGT